MTRELSQTELKVVFAALMDAATLVQALCRNNDSPVLDHLHASLNNDVNVLATPDIHTDQAKGEILIVRDRRLQAEAGPSDGHSC